MDDTQRHTIAGELIQILNEHENSNTLLHIQADRLAAAGQLQQALRLLWSGIETAKAQNDDYLVGAGRFHMALAYFVAAGADDWNRAAELCEKAAHYFEQKKCVHEQGVCFLARGYMYEALCDEKEDRWTQGFQSFTAAYMHLRQGREEYAERARNAYAVFGTKYVAVGLSHEAAAKAHTTESASAGGFTFTTAPETDLESGPKEKTPGTANAHGAPPPDAARPAQSAPGATASSPGANGASTQANSGTAPPSEPEKNKSEDAEKKSDRTAPDHERASKWWKFPAGLVSRRAPTANHFGRWAFVLFLGTAMIVFFTVGLVYKALPLLSANEPEFLRNMGVGLFVGLLTVAIVLLVLAFTQQLYVRVPAAHAAVIVQGQRAWHLPKTGLCLLWPMHQDIVAVVPVGEKKYDKFRRDVAIHDNGSLSAHVEADYFVVAPALFWERVLADLPRSGRLGIPIPLHQKEILATLEIHVQSLIERSVIEVTNQDAYRTANMRVLKEKIKEVLCCEAASDGLAFKAVEFSIMLTMPEEPA